MAWALWLQYGLGLEPCPLCMFQRVAVIATGVVFLVGGDPQSAAHRRAPFYAVLTLSPPAPARALAAWHVWLQALPKDPVAACGMGLNYMMETLPFTDVIGRC